MTRFTPTRSAATLTMAIAGVILVALIISAPFTAVTSMTVLYTAMIVTGAGMMLRRRVFDVPVRQER